MKKIILTILDGVGLSDKNIGNAVELSKPKFLNYCLNNFPNLALFAGEEYVGLPIGQMGNSEVGHINIGAGRIVPQTLFKINKLIENEQFYSNKELNKMFEKTQKVKGSLHLIGLLSDGGIHSHINHLLAIIKHSKNYDIPNIFLHIILDGRDTKPNVSKEYLDILQKEIKNIKNVSIATISGRYFAMDRESNWDRTSLSYQAIVSAKGNTYKTYNDFYLNTKQKILDEFVSPFVLKGYKGVKPYDTLLFFNFRADRMRQIVYAFADKQLSTFDRELIEPLAIYTLTDYGDKMKELNVKTILPEEEIKNTLTQVLVKNNKKVLKVAETTKYAHVTYFFNGGKEKPFDNEDRILLPSDSISTFDIKPKMQAEKIAKSVINAVKSLNYDAIILNFANGDMVGHSGNLPATIKAIKTVDKQLKKIYKSALKYDYLLIITSDHGNAEQMLDDKGAMWTAHTLNKVPFIICSKDYELLNEQFSLGNISPTILEIMGIKAPKEMTAKSMLKT